MVALAPRAPGLARLRSLATSAGNAVKSAAVKAITPHKAALSNLTSIPLTLAGAGCIDFSAYHLSHGIGWLVTGISLVLLEHVIADEP